MKKLPKFKTPQEEIRFWQRHSIAEYWGDLEETLDTFSRPKLTPVTLKFDPLLLKKLKMLCLDFCFAPEVRCSEGFLCPIGRI